MGTDNASRVLLVQDILKEDPCLYYRNKLLSLFGETGEIAVTVDLAVSQASIWDWDWIADVALTREGRRSYFDRKREFRESRAFGMQLLWDAYDNVHTESWKQFDEEVDAAIKAGATYLKAEAAALAEHEVRTEAVKAALNAAAKVRDERYAKDLATAFAEVYISEAPENTQDCD